MNTLILVSIQTFIFITYVIFIKVRFSNLSSISLSWYKLQEQRNKQGYLFTFFCWGLAIPLVLFADIGGWLFFMAGSGLAFTGAATSFKEDTTDIVHFTGATISIVGSLLGLLLIYNNWVSISVVTMGIIYMGSIKKKNLIYWIEILSFVSIILGLLYTVKL